MQRLLPAATASTVQRLLWTQPPMQGRCSLCFRTFAIPFSRCRQAQYGSARLKRHSRTHE
eukprot:15445413-Alexandrium_andersonii.AAC.1